MSKGYVYILTNQSMPGLVKIGKTTRTPQQRCDELWHTGVPTPFEVASFVFSPHCHSLERDMHMAFMGARVSDSREFFHVSASEAYEELEYWHLKQLDRMVSEFLPGHLVLHESLAPDVAAIVKFSEDIGISPARIVRSIRFLDPEAISSAVRMYEGEDHG